MKSLIHRRKVLKSTIALPFIGSALLACSEAHIDKKEENKRKLKILILGGTSFLGPHQIAYALERGHEVTTFTRGKTKPTIHPEVFEKVKMLIGDRENDLSALETGEWDVVIDNSGRKVEWTKATAELLQERVEHYLYTSSTGVYYPYMGSDIKEDTKLVLETPHDLEFEYERMEYDYGVMKTLSEIEARKSFGEDRTIVVRPTYMMGPGDRTDRFVHWPLRLAEGGEVLVPGKSDDPVQYIDVRDVAEFMIRLAENKMSGTFNASGPANAENIRAFVSKASSAFEAEHIFVNIDDYDFLEENKILYLIPWIPPTGKNYGSARSNNRKAITAGLTFRKLSLSILDIRNWWLSNAVDEERKNKYNSTSLARREAEVIKKWKAI